MKILLLCGSIAKRSHTYALLKYIEQLLQEKGVETIFWDLKTEPLIIALPEYHADPMKNPNKEIKKFVAAIEEADGIVLGSPLYHGSYSGVLKNALDNLALDGFENKPVGLVCNGSNARAGHSANDHLRLVVRALRGYSLQTHVGSHGGDYEDQANGYILVSQDVKDRCIALVNELVKLAKLLK